MKYIRWSAWFARGLLCFVTGMALTAAAQMFDMGNSSGSSMDTFGGNPDSSKFILIPSDNDDWTRHFRIGAIVGMNISADFKSKGTFNVSGNNAANGIYDDGYVREDDTGNAGGLTSYWGYNNKEQLVGNTLTMHGASSYSTTGSSSENGGAFPGFDLAYGDNIWYWKHARVGWEFGFGLLPINISEKSSSPATVNQSVYTFNTGGIVVPGAGYQGGPSGEGPVISGTPSSVTTNSTSGTVTGSHTLDVMLYTFRLGPAFYWDLSQHLGIQVGAGPALGLVSGSYHYNETITTSTGSTRNHGSFDFTDVTYGGYVNGTLLYHIINDADLYVGAQYMPMGDANLTSSGGSVGKTRISAGNCLHFPPASTGRFEVSEFGKGWAK